MNISVNDQTVTLHAIYDKLMSTYGPQYWWPGDTPFEVCVGAILTQSTAWANVEKAIKNVKDAGALSLEAIYHLPITRLAELIYPSGYYNAKALKVKAFVCYVKEQYGDLDNFLAVDMINLREQLLSIHGIGEETADSVLLYAANKPSFVIDAYTRRIFFRLGLFPENVTYSALRTYFMNKLSPDVLLFNEYHALLVRLGKEICRKKPLCPACCLVEVCANKSANAHCISER